MENTDDKEESSCEHNCGPICGKKLFDPIWSCYCGEECTQYDEYAIQKSLAQGSSVCACGECEVRIFHDDGKFTHRHTERILWSTSKLGTDTNCMKFLFQYNRKMLWKTMGIIIQ